MRQVSCGLLCCVTPLTLLYLYYLRLHPPLPAPSVSFLPPTFPSYRPPSLPSTQPPSISLTALKFPSFACSSHYLSSKLQKGSSISDSLLFSSSITFYLFHVLLIGVFRRPLATPVSLLSRLIIFLHGFSFFCLCNMSFVVFKWRHNQRQDLVTQTLKLLGKSVLHGRWCKGQTRVETHVPVHFNGLTQVRRRLIDKDIWQRHAVDHLNPPRRSSAPLIHAAPHSPLNLPQLPGLLLTLSSFQAICQCSLPNPNSGPLKVIQFPAL